MIIVEEINEVFNLAEEVAVYVDGEREVYGRDSQKFCSVLSSWNNMIYGAHSMPAFGVSLNGETLKARNFGRWVEFIFGDVYAYNEMPFERLLIEVNKNSSGFNLIRYNSEYGYEGRCFYLDLVDKNMDRFYDEISNI